MHKCLHSLKLQASLPVALLHVMILYYNKVKIQWKNALKYKKNSNALFFERKWKIKHGQRKTKLLDTERNVRQADLSFHDYINLFKVINNFNLINGIIGDYQIQEPQFTLFTCSMQYIKHWLLDQYRFCRKPKFHYQQKNYISYKPVFSYHINDNYTFL